MSTTATGTAGSSGGAGTGGGNANAELGAFTVSLNAAAADNTAPAVRITKAPKNKAKVSGTVKIYYTGSDKYGIKNYQLLVNGKVVQTHTSTANPFTFVASKYGKNITVQVRAYDVAGNVTNTAKLSYHR